MIVNLSDSNLECCGKTNNTFKYRVFLCITVYHTETEDTLQHLQHAWSIFTNNIFIPIEILFLKLLHFTNVTDLLTANKSHNSIGNWNKSQWYIHKVTFILTVTFIDNTGTIQSYWPLESINSRRDKVFKMQLELNLGFCGAKWLMILPGKQAIYLKLRYQTTDTMC